MDDSQRLRTATEKLRAIEEHGVVDKISEMMLDDALELLHEIEIESEEAKRHVQRAKDDMDSSNTPKR